MSAFWILLLMIFGQCGSWLYEKYSRTYVVVWIASLLLIMAAFDYVSIEDKNKISAVSIRVIFLSACGLVCSALKPIIAAIRRDQEMTMRPSSGSELRHVEDRPETTNDGVVKRSTES